MFTRMLGRTVRKVDGTRVGKVDDLIISLGETDPLVVALRVHVSRRRRLRAPWSGAPSCAGEFIVAADLVEDELMVHEVLLGRDVLDTQIFDVRGRRMTRVADVELEQRDGQLRVVGVDVGAAPVLKRLGLGAFARWAMTDVIPWTDLHLTSVRGHAVQLDTPTARVHTLAEEELAELGARLPPQAKSRLYARRPHAAARARELEAGIPESRPRHRFGPVLRFRGHAPS